MKSLPLTLALVGAIAAFTSYADSPKESPPAVITESGKVAVLESRVHDLEDKVLMLRSRLLERDGRYSVRKGDTGVSIAVMFDLTLADMMVLNPGVTWSRLKVGQLITVKKETEPNQSPEPTTTPVTPPADARVAPAAVAAHL
jgi:LysM repeat protein